MSTSRKVDRSELHVLPLVLKGEWYDMIASGEKKEEYREAKPYWVKRLWKFFTDAINSPAWDQWDVVGFSRGYRKPDMFFGIVGYERRTAEQAATHPEWGETEIDRFVIKLGERLEVRP